MLIDIYDFDKTVFPKESTTLFWKYCIKRNPGLLRYLPHQLRAVFTYFLSGRDLTFLKSEFLCFVKGIETEAYVNDFWNVHIKEINEWFLPENRKNPAVVISASPEFLLKPVCERLKVFKLIATKTDSNGKIIGVNCKGSEKVRRLKCELPDFEAERAFSDSLKSDKWILNLAIEKYQVTGTTAKRIQVDTLQ